MRAVILAGGRGTRLLPYTTVLPKPLLPIGDMPILELLIRQLRQSGIQQITLAVGYLAQLIMAYFEDGKKLEVEIEYSFEQEPLGTAGPIALLNNLDESFLVMNGDLLTDLDFEAMCADHRNQNAIATIGISQHDVKIPLGVIETNSNRRVTSYTEKPVFHYQASMGIYVFEPTILKYIPKGERLDLPDLVDKVIRSNQQVNAYLHNGFWLDIGSPAEYQHGLEEFANLKERLLKQR
ncbi:MAG: NTP transferase domain-containing protein [Chloroflexi bacterium]|nr:NTP transferase domain-containing protein [Chloroflexota bacterium]